MLTRFKTEDKCIKHNMQVTYPSSLQLDRKVQNYHSHARMNLTFIICVKNQSYFTHVTMAISYVMYAFFLFVRISVFNVRFFMCAFFSETSDEIVESRSCVSLLQFAINHFLLFVLTHTECKL